MELYFTDLASSAPAEWALLENRLDSGERERLTRLKNASARHRSLCAHLLVRVLACERLAVPNHSLRLTAADRGKPALEGYPGFAFSLSHTAEAVAAAVAGNEVGVDIERVRTVNLELVKRFFTAGENAYILNGLEGCDRRFFEVWTRKEACIKRTGMGLATPLPFFDVLTGEWIGELVTFSQGDYLLSACCAEPAPAKVRVITAEALLACAKRLDEWRG